MKRNILFYFCLVFIYFLIDVYIRHNPWYESIITVLVFFVLFISYDVFFRSNEHTNRS